MTNDFRALPDGPGSRPSDGAASSGVSPLRASIPNAEKGPTPWWLVNALILASRSPVPSLQQQLMREASEEIGRLRALVRIAYAEGWEDGWLGGTACPTEEYTIDGVEDDWSRSDIKRALAAGLAAASAIEARRAATPQSDAVEDESPVGEAETPEHSRENPNG